MASWTTAIRTWATEVLTSSNLNAQLRDFAASFGPWGAFGSGSSWTGSVSNPSLGNGTWDGTYRQTQKTVDFNIVLTMGSLTTFGSGLYSIALPVTPARDFCCSVVLIDISSGQRYDGTAWCTPVQGVYRIIFSDGGSGMGPASPITLATGDELIISGTYEAA
jgi:hypothetical protein